MQGQSTWKGEDGVSLDERFYPMTQIGKIDPTLAQAFTAFEVSGFDIPAIEGAAPGVLIHVTNAKYELPKHWEVTRYDPRATLDGGHDYTGLILGEYPREVYALHLARTYFTAKLTGSPSFCSVDWGPKGSRRRFNRVAAQHPQNPDKIVCLVNTKGVGLGNLFFGKAIKRSFKQVERLAVHAGETRISLKAGIAFGISVDTDGEALKERALGSVTYDR